VHLAVCTIALNPHSTALQLISVSHCRQRNDEQQRPLPSRQRNDEQHPPPENTPSQVSSNQLLHCLRSFELTHVQLSHHSLSLFRHKMGNLRKYIRLHISRNLRKLRKYTPAHEPELGLRSARDVQ